MKKIKVLLVDDQVLFVKSLKMVLESNDQNVEVVGIAYNGEEAMRQLHAKAVDIVLLDIKMPGKNGVETTRAIHAEFPDVKVLILTTFDDRDYIYRVLKFGAAGYLLKDMPPEDLITALKAVKTDSLLISPSLKPKLIDHLNIESSEHPTESTFLRDLSKREKEILTLIVQGYSNQEIGQFLYISEQTVKNHVSTIYSKLGVHDRLKIIQLFREQGQG